jgi:hypothetical protein
MNNTLDTFVLIVFVVFFGGPVLLWGIAFFTGNAEEKKHYESIVAREEALRHIMVVPVKRLPEYFSGCHLVHGSVVISSNRFTRVLAIFRLLLGGNVTSFETLLDRARREAVLRMKEEAAKLGANMILNMKFGTVPLMDGDDQGPGGIVEVFVYGTAGKCSTLYKNNNP